uniref:BAHD acyltransferase n=1 Tax=Fagus sylvatica TaxID=28930 RepID=A0A2N9F387_FAGSY
MASIRLISTSTVKAASHKEYPTHQRIELTPWDLQLLLVDPIQKGLLFHKPKDQSEITTLIHHLKTSLSRTLDFFTPFAGRLATIENNDNTISYFIDINNAGAQFVHALAIGVSVADIIEPVYVPRQLVHSFFPLNGVLLKRWFLDGIDCPIRIPLSHNDNSDGFALPPLKETVFHFTKAKIATLKAKANSEIGTNKKSSLQAVLTHLWRSIIRSRNLDPNQQVSYRLLIGVRPRLHPPLPEEYLGNAVQAGTVTIKAGDLLKRGLGYAAWEMNKMVALHTEEKLRSFLESWVEKPRLLTESSVAGNALVTSSSPRFNVYGNDFGWGKPVAVRSGAGNKTHGKITVFPGVEEGSIDIEACLSPEVLVAMGNDYEFMHV